MSGKPVKLRTSVGGQATDLPVIPVVVAALPAALDALPPLPSDPAQS